MRSRIMTLACLWSVFLLPQIKSLNSEVGVSNVYYIIYNSYIDVQDA